MMHAPTCPACGGVLAWAPGMGASYCEACVKWTAPGTVDPPQPNDRGTDALATLRDRVAELEAIVAVLEPTLGTCQCGARLIGQHYSYELCDCGARVAMQRWEPRR